ncbi:unnamed protein product [Prorocentrum cordatum]|uniref:Uncharacterized protein n=1 Tax=Prorocentrum cordatum TaxID=2364126 RepID=A0ABN9UNA9_9DINO|nr:unnamed protein product [Polarella glacialis]
MLQGSAPGSLMCYGTATFCSRWAGICSSTASNVFARSPLRAAGGAAAHCCTRAGRPERADALAESAGRAAGAACAVADTRGMRREEQREEEEEEEGEGEGGEGRRRGRAYTFCSLTRALWPVCVSLEESTQTPKENLHCGILNGRRELLWRRTARNDAAALCARPDGLKQPPPCGHSRAAAARRRGEGEGH